MQATLKKVRTLEMNNNYNNYNNYDNNWNVATASINAYNDAMKEVNKIISNTIAFITRVFH